MRYEAWETVWAGWIKNEQASVILIQSVPSISRNVYLLNVLIKWGAYSVHGCKMNSPAGGIHCGSVQWWYYDYDGLVCLPRCTRLPAVKPETGTGLGKRFKYQCCTPLNDGLVFCSDAWYAAGTGKSLCTCSLLRQPYLGNLEEWSLEPDRGKDVWQHFSGANTQI